MSNGFIAFAKLNGQQSAFACSISRHSSRFIRCGGNLKHEMPIRQPLSASEMQQPRTSFISLGGTWARIPCNSRCRNYLLPRWQFIFSLTSSLALVANCLQALAAKDTGFFLVILSFDRKNINTGNYRSGGTLRRMKGCKCYDGGLAITQHTGAHRTRQSSSIPVSLEASLSRGISIHRI